jgi:hypothetical protein
MTTLVVELDPAGEPPLAFAGDTAPLVYFLSFAFATRYGAQHELSKATALLRDTHKIDLKPLLTFADRAAEDEANRAELERLWQDAAPLAESCRAVIAAIDADAAVRELLADFPTLRERIDELGRIASWAAETNRRVRLTYTMG